MEQGYSSDFAAELASSLEWWAQAGVDCLVEESPRNWLKPIAPPAIPAIPGRSAAPPAPPPEALPDQLDLFREWLRTSADLPYAAGKAPRICPSGDPLAGLMILAAVPSSEDCATGTLLSGAAGRLFDRMLAAIGRSRDTAYIAGLSCLRPPAGRLDAAGGGRCAELARHHVALAAPKALLLLGDACSNALLGMGAAKARGRVHRVETRTGSYDAIVTLHPDFLLTQPAAKPLAWADLLMLMEVLG